MRVYVTQVYIATAWPEANELQFNTQRQAAPTQTVALNPGETWSFEHTFTLTDESLNLDNVAFIVWAQDDLVEPPAMIRQVAIHDHGGTIPCDCPGDFDCTLVVDVNDMLHLLGAWGTDGGDANGDGDTDEQHQGEFPWISAGLNGDIIWGGQHRDCPTGQKDKE